MIFAVKLDKEKLCVLEQIEMEEGRNKTNVLFYTHTSLAKPLWQFLNKRSVWAKRNYKSIKYSKHVHRKPNGSGAANLRTHRHYFPFKLFFLSAIGWP